MLNSQTVISFTACLGRWYVFFHWPSEKMCQYANHHLWPEFLVPSQATEQTKQWIQRFYTVAWHERATESTMSCTASTPSAASKVCSTSSLPASPQNASRPPIICRDEPGRQPARSEPGPANRKCPRLSVNSAFFWLKRCAALLRLWGGKWEAFHSYGHLLVITGYFYGIIHSINGVLLVLITGKWPYIYSINGVLLVS